MILLLDLRKLMTLSPGSFGYTSLGVVTNRSSSGILSISTDIRIQGTHYE